MTSVLPNLERALVDAAARSISAAPERSRRPFGKPDRQVDGRPSVRRMVPVIALLAVAAVAGALVLSLSSSPSIIARAYAATNTADHVLFYRTTTYSPGIDKPNDYEIRARSSYTVWTSGNRTRWSGTMVLGGTPGVHRTVLDQEVVIDGRHLAVWEATPQDQRGVITETKSRPSNSGCTVTEVSYPACGDPLKVVRRLYRSNVLRLAGRTTYQGHQVDILAATSAIPAPHGFKAPQILVRVLVDASSFLPVQMKISSANGQTTTTTIADFTRLPLTATNQKLLNMSPHPGAPDKHISRGPTVVKSRTTARHP